MNNLAGESAQKLDDILSKYRLDISVTQLKKDVPRINFKKVKLSRFINVNNDLAQRNISRFYLNDEILKLNFSFIRKTSETITDNVVAVKNPLRKKKDLDKSVVEDSSQEKVIQQKEEKIEPEALTPAESKELKIEKKDLDQPLTFNLEAQITEHDENIIYTPSTVSLPPLEENLLSASGEQQSLIWPPTSKEDDLMEEDKPKDQKKKPYFISDENLIKEELQDRPQSAEHQFPWDLSRENYQGLDSIFGGGLEAELIDTSNNEPITPPSDEAFISSEKTIEEAFNEQIKTNLPSLPEDISGVTDKVILKALFPKYEFEQDKEILNPSVFKIDLRDNGLVETSTSFFSQGRAKKMFEKLGSIKLTPIRIVIIGGTTITAASLIWTNLNPNFMSTNYLNNQGAEIVIRKPTESKIFTNQKTSFVSDKQIDSGLASSAISPISEGQRLVLIQKARESLEGRTDPFRQETIVSAQLEAAGVGKLPEKPQEIQVQRKQFELVGVISVQSKNLALVNVYTIDYAITLDDDKATRDNKLKQALGMAVPNRIEVSVLDPIEDWYVKSIIKGKSRIEDPSVELVKEDKKFDLKVGQKLLLPEDKPLPPPPISSSSVVEETN